MKVITNLKVEFYLFFYKELIFSTALSTSKTLSDSQFPFMVLLFTTMFHYTRPPYSLKTVLRVITYNTITTAILKKIQSK